MVKHHSCCIGFIQYHYQCHFLIPSRKGNPHWVASLRGAPPRYWYHRVISLRWHFRLAKCTLMLHNSLQLAIKSSLVYTICQQHSAGKYRSSKGVCIAWSCSALCGFKTSGDCPFRTCHVVWLLFFPCVRPECYRWRHFGHASLPPTPFAQPHIAHTFSDQWVKIKCNLQNLTALNR